MHWKKGKITRSAGGLQGTGREIFCTRGVHALSRPLPRTSWWWWTASTEYLFTNHHQLPLNSAQNIPNLHVDWKSKLMKQSIKKISKDYTNWSSHVTITRHRSLVSNQLPYITCNIWLFFNFLGLTDAHLLEALAQQQVNKLLALAHTWFKILTSARCKSLTRSQIFEPEEVDWSIPT